jgi:hypothetical protein
MNTHISQIKAEIVANGGVTNFGSWLAMALHQYKFAIVGDWENPELSMSDECVAEAFQWLMGGHNTNALKAEFIFDSLLQEGDEKRAALLFYALRSGDFMPLVREYVEDLVVNGGHWQSLQEQVFGPDRRPAIADEINKDLDAEKAAAARAA